MSLAQYQRPVDRPEEKTRPVVDGFTLSASMLYLPTSFRANALAQLEVLRRAASYRTRWMCVPDNLNEPVAAYGQVEHQVSVLPGTYIWGACFTITDTVEDVDLYPYVFVQVTDACTETPLLSDYAKSSAYESIIPGVTGNAGGTRNPYILPHPRLVGKPGQVDVEIYNSYSTDLTCQLVLLVAEPVLPPPEIERIMQERRIREMVL